MNSELLIMSDRKYQLDLFLECGSELTLEEINTLREAFTILNRTLRQSGIALTNPERVADYLKLTLANRPHEVFVVLFLDNQNRLIEAQEMFRGTINATSVYPREIAYEALRLNAASCILAHNHPSGITEPSTADQNMTRKIKVALELLNIQVLDHFVIGGTQYQSFSELNLL